MVSKEAERLTLIILMSSLFDVDTVINALQVFAPVDGTSNGLEQIFELIRRTDSLPLRNESTRVLVNLIKTLYVPSSSSLTSPIKTSTAGDLGPKEMAERRHAFDELSCEEVADALAEMVGRNLKYQVLLNEGIMALTLLASQPLGRTFPPIVLCTLC